MIIPKINPGQITYRDSTKFDSLIFNNELKEKNLVTIENIDNCAKFDERFLQVLEKHASLKRRVLRANHVSYVSKSLQTASDNEEILPAKKAL